MDTIADPLREEITRRSHARDALAEAGSFEAAIAEYNEAWKLIPEPKTDWDASTWVLAAIGDAAFQGGFMKSAQDALDYAMHCPGGIGNPCIHLRLGQVLLSRGDEKRAADELMRAYMVEGEEIFRTEHPKYLAFLKSRAEGV